VNNDLKSCYIQKLHRNRILPLLVQIADAVTVGNLEIIILDEKNNKNGLATQVRFFVIRFVI